MECKAIYFAGKSAQNSGLVSPHLCVMWERAAQAPLSDQLHIVSGVECVVCDRTPHTPHPNPAP